MRFVTLILDGNIHAHLVVSRAPDLKRREIAAQTGSAEIVFCQMADGFSTSEVMSKIAARFCNFKVHENVYRTPAKLMIRELRWQIFVEPMLQKLRRVPVKMLRRMARTFA